MRNSTHPVWNRPPNPEHAGLGLERRLVCRQDGIGGIDDYLLRFGVDVRVESKVWSMQNHPSG